MKLKLKGIIGLVMLMIISSTASSRNLEFEPEIVGSDEEKRIVATFEGFQRDLDGRLETYRINLKNVSEQAYELYIEVQQFYRGALILLDPAKMSQGIPPTLGSIFDDDNFRQDHDRAIPVKLTKIEPGETLQYDLLFKDYVDFSALDSIDKVNVFMRSSIYMFDEGADYTVDDPVGIIGLLETVYDVPVKI